MIHVLSVLAASAAGPDTSQFSAIAGNISIVVLALAGIMLVPLIMVAGVVEIWGGLAMKSTLRHHAKGIVFGYGVIVLGGAIAGLLHFVLGG